MILDYSGYPVQSGQGDWGGCIRFANAYLLRCSMLMILETESQVCFDIRDAHLGLFECYLSHDGLREWLSPDLDLPLRAAVFLPVLFPFLISRVLPLRLLSHHAIYVESSPPRSVSAFGAAASV